jgi:hypothetical protein
MNPMICTIALGRCDGRKNMKNAVRSNQILRERRALSEIQRGGRSFKSHFGFCLDSSVEREVVDYLLSMIQRQILLDLYREQTASPFYPEPIPSFDVWLARADGGKSSCAK